MRSGIEVPSLMLNRGAIDFKIISVNLEHIWCLLEHMRQV